MAKQSKEEIVNAYRDLVRRTGRRVGEGVFKRETGISPYYWRGGYWPKWSVFQAEAGFEPNKPKMRVEDEVILRCFAELARELGRVPTQADLQLKRRRNQSFPDKASFARWGNTDARDEQAATFCERNPDFADVLALLRDRASASLESRL